MSERDWRKDTDTVESPLSRGATGPTGLFELFGESPGRLIRLIKDRTFVGRDGGSNTGSSVQIAHGSVSRQHAVIVRGREGLSVRDLGSTNGTFVNGHRIDAHTLCHGDRVKFGRTLFKVLVDPDLESLVAGERRRLERIDTLTQVLNRKTFIEEVRFRLQAGKTTLVVGTITDYEGLLSRFSGVAIEHLLGGLGQVLSKRAGHDHDLGRVGEAAFALLIREDARDEGQRVANSLARHVAATSFTLDGHPIPLTLTFGVAVGAPGQTPEDLLAEAASALPRQLIALD